LSSYREAELYACSEIRGGPTSSAIKVSVDGRELVLEAGWEYGDIMAVYVDRIYDWLPVEGRTVVDVGASIGDSALYFYARGARRVVALEPWPKNYHLLERNVRLNGAEDVITPVNVGLAGSSGTIHLEDGTEDSLHNQLRESTYGTPVPMRTLQEIVDEYQIESAVLKLDCEGAEYEILSQSNDQLIHRFSHVQLEYHYGRSPLVRTLRALGYRVRSTWPTIRVNRERDWPVMRMGDLWARRGSSERR
jgi:FkbM family methyltransferase